MNNTAISAGLQTIMFANEKHRDFYKEYLPQCRHQDVYHKALIYCIGISEDARKHIHRIYDFQSGCVQPECLHEGWITSGSARVVRLAFNLYCNGTPSVNEYEDPKEQMDEIRLYSVEDIFCCGYAPFFWQAVQIRYPEYCYKKVGGLSGSLFRSSWWSSCWLKCISDSADLKQHPGVRKLSLAVVITTLNMQQWMKMTKGIAYRKFCGTSPFMYYRIFIGF